eukprot:TRINITY_DN11223_c0_g1_i1.p1 TRINITY_DN11223_c0_g1~~TRINITY_DN11223_c0_g1_i1.p1  ORF type:complete len:166 (-),score=40.21 TRINITY_DN11223_c0_g1_i1:105-533(-)
MGCHSSKTAAVPATSKLQHEPGVTLLEKNPGAEELKCEMPPSHSAEVQAAEGQHPRSFEDSQQHGFQAQDAREVTHGVDLELPEDPAKDAAEQTISTMDPEELLGASPKEVLDAREAQASSLWASLGLNGLSACCSGHDVVV